MNGKSFTFILAKAVFLLMNTVILPLAIFYILQTKSFLLLDSKFVLIGTYFIVPFWLVLFLGLGMYRFPLETKPAVGLMLSSLGSFLFFGFVNGQNWLASFYSMFIISFAAVILVLLKKVFYEIGTGGWQGRVWKIGMAIFFALFLASISGPIIQQLQFMSMVPSILTIAIIIFHTGSLFWHTNRNFILDESAEIKKMREVEFKKWTNPVVVTLLLSMLGTIFLGVFLSPHNQAALSKILGS